MAGTDFEKIDRNIKKLVGQGVDQSVIDEYLTYEDVTHAQVLEGTKSFWDKTGDFIGRAVDSVAGAVRGKVDPLFADTPGFTAEGLGTGDFARVVGSQYVALDDESYGDAIREILGDRLLDETRDEHGQPIIAYRGDDDQTYVRYINQPGLDMEDIGRGAAAAIPFIPGGALARVGAAAAGGGAAVRIGGQALAGGAVSMGQDLGAGGMGSKQGIDYTRAAMAAATAGVFEGLAAPAARAWDALFRRGGLDKATGKLKPDAAAAAREMGLDPDTMNAKLATDFSRNLARGTNMDEIAARARAREFSLNMTKGQTGKSPAQLDLEQRLSSGALGKEAANVLSNLKSGQRDAVEKAVNHQIAGRLAPDMLDDLSSGGPANAGQRIGDSLRRAANAAVKHSDQLWSEVGPMHPAAGGFDMLPSNIISHLDDAAVITHPQSTPTASRMLDMLAEYKAGGKLATNHPFLDPTGAGGKAVDIDTIRRVLRQSANSASREGGDKRAAEAIYQGFNSWIDDMAAQSALHGAPDAAAKLKIARGFYRDFKNDFAPITDTGRPNPAAKILRSVMDESVDTPERIADVLFGAAGVTVKPKPGVVPALSNIKKIMSKSSPEDWNAVRLAYWTKISQDKLGRVLPLDKLRDNLAGAHRNQASVMGRLYSKDEIAEMMRLHRSLLDLTAKGPGVNQQSLKRLEAQFRNDSVGKTFLKAAQQRATFSQHDFLKARIYQLLAKGLPMNLFGVRHAIHRGVAEQTTRDFLTRPIPSTWGAGGALPGVIGATGVQEN